MWNKFIFNSFLHCCPKYSTIWQPILLIILILLPFPPPFTTRQLFCKTDLTLSFHFYMGPLLWFLLDVSTNLVTTGPYPDCNLIWTATVQIKNTEIKYDKILGLHLLWSSIFATMEASERLCLRWVMQGFWSLTNQCRLYWNS